MTNEFVGAALVALLLVVIGMLGYCILLLREQQQQHDERTAGAKSARQCHEYPKTRSKSLINGHDDVLTGVDAPRNREEQAVRLSPERMAPPKTSAPAADLGPPLQEAPRQRDLLHEILGVWLPNLPFSKRRELGLAFQSDWQPILLRQTQSVDGEFPLPYIRVDGKAEPWDLWAIQAAPETFYVVPVPTIEAAFRRVSESILSNMSPWQGWFEAWPDESFAVVKPAEATASENETVFQLSRPGRIQTM